MKATLLALITTGAVLAGGCATSRESDSPVGPVGVAAPSAATVGYDDRQIASIRREETIEAQLLEWFGRPESRELKPDGRAQLTWSFASRMDSLPGDSGRLSASLSPDGKVEAYWARRQPPLERKTVEFVEKSPADLREHMAQWAREGWNVHSVSPRLPQADGTVHRRADLSRTNVGTASGVGYDDRRIAEIQRGQTTEAQLVEWFGPPRSRDVKPDGRAQLVWSFVGRTDGESGHSGELSAILSPDGKVNAYSARRGSE